LDAITTFVDPIEIATVLWDLAGALVF